MLGTSVAPNPDFSTVDALLREYVANASFPGAVAIIGDKTGILHEAAVGAHTLTPNSVSGSVFSTRDAGLCRKIGVLTSKRRS